MATSASIFCDGACRGNGTRAAVAGWAWAYWPGAAAGEPLRFGAERLAGEPATNQRAELTALLEALRWWRDAGGGGPIVVYTDSMYAINCTTKWGPGWKRRGWKRDSGEPLLNLDLIRPLVDMWVPRWRLQHVRGHQTGAGPLVWGNNWVDRAAVAASLGEGRSFKVAPADVIVRVTDLKKVAAAPTPKADVIEICDAECDVVSDGDISFFTDRTAAPPARVGTKQSDIRAWFG